jgi:uracil-DNA glycosylase
MSRPERARQRVPKAVAGVRTAAAVPALLADVRRCRLCAGHLPFGPRPVLQVDPRARILIAGQAPGRRVHESGVPFQDASGERLRDWMGIDATVFYDAARVAILPMGFCYPGAGRSGDRPPRPECAPAWRSRLLATMPAIEITLVVGRYALDYHLGQRQKPTLTETVRAWRDFWPTLLPLPHPSPRNNLWLRRHAWFAREVLPALRRRVHALV